MATAILKEAAQVAASLDEVDAKAEDVRLQGKREPEVRTVVSNLPGDPIQALLASFRSRYRGGDGLQRLIQLNQPSCTSVVLLAEVEDDPWIRAGREVIEVLVYDDHRWHPVQLGT